MNGTLTPGDIPGVVKDLCQTLRGKGHGAWVVGGCVRDLLLGRDVHDWDLCTTARPDALVKIFPRAIPTGIEHGTVTVVVDRVHYEVTTLRGETTYTDGRRPDAVFFLDDVTHDLARRDFTVNAMAYDPLTDTLVDPFGGMSDLAARTLRAVGEPSARFNEDGLRILRGARLAATLSFTVEAATEAAMQTALGVFQKVSAERVRDEWLKALAAPAPSTAFQVMRRTGILGVTLPALVTRAGQPLDGGTHGDAWAVALAAVDALPRDRPLVRLAALLVDRTRAFRWQTSPDGAATVAGPDAQGVDTAARWLRAYRFANHERDQVTALVASHGFWTVDGWTDAGLRRWLRGVGPAVLPDVLALAHAESLARGDTVLAGTVAALGHRVQGVCADGMTWSIRDLQVTGADLMRDLGMAPSRVLGETLAMLLDRVTDQPSLNDRERLLALARAWLATRGG